MKKTRLLSAVLAAALAFTALPANRAKSDPAAFAADNVSRVSVHDPSIVKNGDTYYVFGSHIDAAKTTDLRNWTLFTNGYARYNNVEFGDLSKNLAKAFAWAGEDLEDCKGGFAVWAPDVVWNPDYINSDGTKGAYLMYFCASSTYIRSVIGFAAAKNIEGPYTFVDTLIYSGFTNNDSYATSDTKNVNRKYTSTNVDELIAAGEVAFNNSWFNKNNFNNQLFPNAIDPTIYYGTDGKMYMCYGSWSGGIFTLEIDKSTGKCIHPKTGTTSDGRMVDSYFGTKISGGYGKSGEGPFIEYNPETGYYYLWVTYGGLTSTGGYNMRVFRSLSPTGPFTDPSGRQAVLPSNPDLDSTGLKVMGNYKFGSLQRAYMACGHNSVLRDDDGKWYIFYHARFDDGSEYHEVRVHSMFFNEEGWPVVAPFEYDGGDISAGGYEEADIAGEYEFIDHGLATNGTIISSQKIKLNADHTISGAVSGKWEQSPYSAAASLTIGGQVYSGYFLAANAENGERIMNFTAVGSDNHTIWGAKTSPYSGSDRKASADYTNKEAQLVIAPETVSGLSASAKIGDSGLLSGVPYFITNINSGLALDLPDGKLEAGTNIQQWDLNRSFAQQWRIVSVDGEWCRLTAMGDESKCAAVAENSAADGINVELQTYTGADNQLFKIVKSGSAYGILSKCSAGKGALDVFEWSKKNGGNVNQYAYHEYNCQLWKISPVYPRVNDGTYAIRDAETGKYLSSAGNLSDEPSVWKVESSGGTYALSPAFGGFAFEAAIVCNKDGSYSIGDDGRSYVLEFVQPEAVPDLTGDANDDGDVSLADVVLLQKFILGDVETVASPLKADADKDGLLTGYDLALVREIVIERGK